MKRRELHVVIGAGISGCLSAITRSRAGYKVVVLERECARSDGTYPVCTQTSNIVSENHSGAEYPFDPQSARDCLDGRIENERFFPEFIFGGKTYSRIIASKSMMDDGHDIVGQCRSNMQVIKSHYEQRCEEDPANAVFGDSREVCHETAGVEGVNDVASAYVTPQRGINPVMVSAVLDWELRTCGIDFREGSSVLTVARREDGMFVVDYVDTEGTTGTLVADQVSVCAATAAFGIAKRLNPSLTFPKLFMALRMILYVDLPEGTRKDFTCLKLEDAFGGMFSPINERCAMIYHPPAAHIMNVVMNPDTCELPPEYAHYLSDGHPETATRAAHTVARLREFYPELSQSQILGAYLKIAINTVADSRVRRNLGVFNVCSGATMTALPKWTMCAVNAKTELNLALNHSVANGNIRPREAGDLLGEAKRTCWETAPPWSDDPAEVTAHAVRHAVNMNVPKVLAGRFGFEE